MSSRSLLFPLLLIVIGGLWFLKASHLMPATSSIIAIALAILGVLVMVTDGINKQSIVAGPFLIYLGLAVYLYFEAWFQLAHVFSVGMICLGLLLLLSRSNAIRDKYAHPTLPPHD